MLPMKAVRLQVGALLAADATTLAPAMNANNIALITSAFVLDENLVVGGLTYATGNGLDPIDCAVGAQEVAIDPITLAQVITLVPGSAAGFRWVTSGGLSVPVTVYGYALLTHSAAALLAAAAFDTPIVLPGDGYQIDADPAQLTVVQQPIN